jgi:hypothetical protein
LNDGLFIRKKSNCHYFSDDERAINPEPYPLQIFFRNEGDQSTLRGKPRTLAPDLPQKTVKKLTAWTQKENMIKYNTLSTPEFLNYV